MNHLVRYRSPDGQDRFEDLDDVEVALQRVEQLRNEEGVSEVRLFREIPVAFRAYFRATLVDAPAVPAAPAAPAAATPPPLRPTRPEGPVEPPAGAMPIPPPPSGGPEQPDNGEGAEQRKISLFNRGQGQAS